jgi:hypothetical protein
MNLPAAGFGEADRERFKIIPGCPSRGYAFVFLCSFPDHSPDGTHHMIRSIRDAPGGVKRFPGSEVILETAGSGFATTMLSRNPDRLVQDKYERGDPGLKTGRGFYDGSGSDPVEVRKAAGERLARLLTFLKK